MSERQAALEKRLQDGWSKIGEAMRNGIEVKTWEDAWVKLLREYETETDALAARKPAQAEMPLNVRRVEAA